MGSSGSKPEPTKTTMSSEQIRTAIKDMFKMSEMNDSVLSDSLGYRDSPVQPSNMNSTMFGGNPAKKFVCQSQRYMEFGQDRPPFATQYGGKRSRVEDNSSSSSIDLSITDTFSDLSSVSEVKSLRDLLIQQNGGCGCGDERNLSNTSAQPIDYSVLKGGAGKDESETSEEKDKKKKVKKSKKDKSDSPSEEEDDDDNDDIDDEEDEEDMEDDDVEDEDMEDETDADVVKSTESSSESSETHSEFDNKQILKELSLKPRHKSHEYSHTTNEKSELGAETFRSSGSGSGENYKKSNKTTTLGAVPFYSSDNGSDFMKNVKNRNRYS